MAGPEYYRSLLSDVFNGRKVIICSGTLAGAGGTAKVFTDLGAHRPLIVAGDTGTGDLPTDDEAQSYVIGTSGGSMMAGIRAFEDALVTPPPELAAAVDAYDPDRRAIVIGTLFSPRELWDRQTFGGRPDRWTAIEDKLVVGEIFDAAGVPQARSEIVAASADALRAAASALDAGLGTAWAGDTKEGWWGGAEYLRWVRSDADFDDAASFYAAHCDRVRVMPFLEGIPCSIHGLVFTDDVAAFRPVEMLTLRHPDRNQLHYSGLATYWDPPDADREQMREAARRIGALLRERAAYRGMFTLDGVMTADGFRPTEINARPGAGVGPQSAASGVNLGMLSNLVVERPELDYHPTDLEAHVLETADAIRGGSCYTVYATDAPVTATTTVSVQGHNPIPDGTLLFGPSAVGGFVRFLPDVSQIPKGPSFAPTAVRVFAYTDSRHDTRLGPLQAAIPVR